MEEWGFLSIRIGCVNISKHYLSHQSWATVFGLRYGWLGLHTELLVDSIGMLFGKHYIEK